eukprot:15452495-Alexandrium_andersonii.AAC.1
MADGLASCQATHVEGVPAAELDPACAFASVQADGAHVPRRLVRLDCGLSVDLQANPVSGFAGLRAGQRQE